VVSAGRGFIENWSHHGSVDRAGVYSKGTEKVRGKERKWKKESGSRFRCASKWEEEGRKYREEWRESVSSAAGEVPAVLRGNLPMWGSGAHR